MWAQRSSVERREAHTCTSREASPVMKGDLGIEGIWDPSSHSFAGKSLTLCAVPWKKPKGKSPFALWAAGAPWLDRMSKFPQLQIAIFRKHALIPMPAPQDYLKWLFIQLMMFFKCLLCHEVSAKGFSFAVELYLVIVLFLYLTLPILFLITRGVSKSLSKPID
jgi:hypothetical protein